MPSRSLLLGLFVLAAVLGGCLSGPAPLPPADLPALRAEWQDLVAARDSLFRSPASPLLPAAREEFEGLSYFDYDTSLVFRVRVRPELARDTFGMVTSTGEVRPFIRYGLFRFETEGPAHTLVALKSVGPGSEGRLFVPFQDGTSGQSTYGGGRYLDIDEAPDGIYTLDFNQAYHPYCVYNPQYSCPIPPSENRLRLPVTAGERLTVEPAVEMPTSIDP